MLSKKDAIPVWGWLGSPVQGGDDTRPGRKDYLAQACFLIATNCPHIDSWHLSASGTWLWGKEILGSHQNHCTSFLGHSWVTLNLMAKSTMSHIPIFISPFPLLLDNLTYKIFALRNVWLFSSRPNKRCCWYSTGKGFQFKKGKWNTYLSLFIKPPLKWQWKERSSKGINQQRQRELWRK